MDANTTIVQIEKSCFVKTRNGKLQNMKGKKGRLLEVGFPTLYDPTLFAGDILSLYTDSVALVEVDHTVLSVPYPHIRIVMRVVPGRRRL